MNKVFKRGLFLLGCVLSFLLVLLPMGMSGLTARADSVVAESEEESGKEVLPRGLFSILSVAIDSGNGQVWGTAKNDFTLFSSKVQVYLELYSSDTLQQSYTTMKLETSRYMSDLDMGEEMTVYGATGGKQKYWLARIYFQVDNNDWTSKVTGPYLIDGNGNRV